MRLGPFSATIPATSSDAPEQPDDALAHEFAAWFTALEPGGQVILRVCGHRANWGNGVALGRFHECEIAEKLDKAGFVGFTVKPVERRNAVVEDNRIVPLMHNLVAHARKPIHGVPA